MKIYLAGSFVDQMDLRPMADRLWHLGHEITGTWLQETKRPMSMPEEVFNKKLAIKDLCEVSRADLVILDNRRSSGGKNVEWGFALGEHQHKQLFLVGEPSTVFHYLADLTFDTWDDLLNYFEEIGTGEWRCFGKNSLDA